MFLPTVKNSDPQLDSYYTDYKRFAISTLPSSCRIWPCVSFLHGHNILSARPHFRFLRKTFEEVMLKLS